MFRLTKGSDSGERSDGSDSGDGGDVGEGSDSGEGSEGSEGSEGVTAVTVEMCGTKKKIIIGVNTVPSFAWY